MPWFRISAFLFACWGVLFAGFASLTNRLAGIDYQPSRHADDWTQLFGLCCLGFAVLLEQAHRSSSHEARRVAANGVLTFTVPCVFLMTYWQLIPDRRWTRFDLGNIGLLLIISCVVSTARRARTPQARKS